MELDLDRIKQLSKKREEENFAFRSFLKIQDSKKVDGIVHDIHNEINAQIDCTKCGNCCGELRPWVDDDDIERLANIDKIPKGEYIEKFVEKNESEGDRYLKSMPCKYFDGKKCSIYPDRPGECRDYPFTHKDEFTSRLFGVIDDYVICPIVFNLYERLKREMRFRF